MFIECDKCNLTLDAANHAEMQIGQYEILVLLKCPKCGSPLLGHSELELDTRAEWYGGEGEPDYLSAERVWPMPQSNISNLSNDIPEDVRKAISDGQRCYEAKVYSAAAVMCGKAIESICKDKADPRKSMHVNLQKMKDEDIIDEKILKWAEVLREEGNLGAHATGHVTKEQDAKDILAFAIAISDYVYVLSEKYNEYMCRRESIKK